MPFYIRGNHGGDFISADAVKFIDIADAKLKVIILMWPEWHKCHLTGAARTAQFNERFLSEKSRFGVEKRLVKPRNDSIIVKTTGKTQM